ncbi:C-type lectin domain family 1 member A [Alligator mississippiensis]|nr:C-type lectin domain family 1 member A [Alligator mississippiensis]
MATAGVLVVKFTQVSHLMSEREVQENLTQQLELLQAQNLNLSETLEQLASSRGHTCTPCPENWLQHGENCYYYFAEWKTWQESEALCSSLDSRFLKIESKKELDFVMKSAQLYSFNSFWIGLSHNGAGQPWLWEDGTPFSSDLFHIPEASSTSSLICVWIQGTNVNTAECSDYKFCICEKMVNPAGIGQKGLSDR